MHILPYSVFLQGRDTHIVLFHWLDKGPETLTQGGKEQIWYPFECPGVSLEKKLSSIWTAWAIRPKKMSSVWMAWAVRLEKIVISSNGLGYLFQKIVIRSDG